MENTDNLATIFDSVDSTTTETRGKKFEGKTAFYSHKKKCGAPQTQSAENFVCQEVDCCFSSTYRRQLMDHMQKQHSLSFPEQSKIFPSYEEFVKWKEDYEKRTKSYFKVQCTKKNSLGETKHFICNRSGNFKSVSSGKRALKSQGVCKIGVNCTSYITVHIAVNSQNVDVKFCDIHYGHENKLAHLRLPQSERVAVASQLSLGIDSQRIVKNMFAACPEELQRQHLLTKQDISNISRAYGLEKVEKHSEDHLSVDAYVEENMQSILLYKRQGENVFCFPKEGETCIFEKNDFALGIMTDFQERMMKKFGGNIVCLDATHGTNSYDFQLITVMVIDEFNEGVPVAWLICNRETHSVLRQFLEFVQKRVGQIFPKVIMTDKAPQFYNAWMNVFGGNPRKMLCHWHVHNNWQKNLSKVRNKETASILYKGLCLLLEESDEIKFKEVLSKAIGDMYLNEETKEFASYFESEWVDSREQWAKCYRIGCGVNTNMHLESFHKALKYGEGYFKGKNNRRLDKCLSVLLQFSSDMNLKRLVKLEKGKTNKKVTEINRRHRDAEKLPLSLVNKTSSDMWAVQSSRRINEPTTSSASLAYTVKKLFACDKGCAVKCNECNICLHSFSCNCPDALTGSMICKHIHLVVLSGSKDCETPESLTDLPENPITPMNAEENYIFQQIASKHNTDLTALKSNMILKLNNLIQMVQNCQQQEQLLNARQHLNSACLAFKLENHDGNFKLKGQIKPPNTNVEKQHRFFSTKQKKKKNKIVYSKPSAEEKTELESSIVNGTSVSDDHTYSNLKN